LLFFFTLLFVPLSLLSPYPLGLNHRTARARLHLSLTHPDLLACMPPPVPFSGHPVSPCVPATTLLFGVRDPPHGSVTRCPHPLCAVRRSCRRPGIRRNSCTTTALRRRLGELAPATRIRTPGPCSLVLSVVLFQQRNKFFSHNKSANSTFQLIFSAKRTGPASSPLLTPAWGQMCPWLR
jgi:hypothetical protein